MPHTYPILLDVSTRLVVIVGGGAVAARKAHGLLAAGATAIRVIAPEICDDMPAEVERIEEEYRPSHLDHAGLVFAATHHPNVNAGVVRDAHERSLIGCRADSDDEHPGDFSTPALWRDGALLVTVSAGGSPALATAVRDELKNHLDPRWARLAEISRALRPRLLAAKIEPSVRTTIFRELASPDLLPLVGIADDEQTIWRWIQCRFPQVGE